MAVESVITATIHPQVPIAGSRRHAVITRAVGLAGAVIGDAADVCIPVQTDVRNGITTIILDSA